MATPRQYTDDELAQISKVTIEYPETLQVITTFIEEQFSKYCQAVKEEDESTSEVVDTDDVLDDNGDLVEIIEIYGPREPRVHKAPDPEKVVFHVVEAAETVLFLTWKWRNELREMEKATAEELYTIRPRFGRMMIDRIFMKIVDDPIFNDVLYKIIMGEEIPYPYFNIHTIRQFIERRMLECSKFIGDFGFLNRNKDRARKEELMTLFGHVMIDEGFITEQEFGQVAVKSANKT